MAAFRAHREAAAQPEETGTPMYDPECVSSTCGFPTTVRFTVAEAGCLGGRLRQACEQVAACAGHAEDIRRSQADSRGLPLAEWLREDAERNSGGRVVRVVAADRL